MAFVGKKNVYIALFLAVLCALPTAAEEVAERFCTVRAVVGSAQVRLNPNVKKVRREMAISRPATVGAPTAVSASVTEEWAPLRLEIVVGERCEIRTGPESEVRLETAEGSMIKIGENTLVEIAAMNTVKKKREVTANTRFRISFGSIVATIKKALAGESPNVRFETPTATAAIRGTTIEIEARGSENTIIRAFDGTVEVAPAGIERFVRLENGKMTEVGPGQRVVVVKDVPKAHKRKNVYLRGEVPPSPGSGGAGIKAPALALAMAVPEAQPAAVKEEVAVVAAETGAMTATRDSAEAKAVIDSVTIALGLNLGGEADTILCIAGSKITVEGVVSPKNAVVNVNGERAKPNAAGAFRRAWVAPQEPGIITLTISAESGGQVRAITRTIRVITDKR